MMFLYPFIIFAVPSIEMDQNEVCGSVAKNDSSGVPCHENITCFDFLTDGRDEWHFQNSGIPPLLRLDCWAYRHEILSRFQD